MWIDKNKEEREQTALQKRILYEERTVKIPVNRNTMRFTCDQLDRIFGGIWTLQYAFSTFDNMHLTAKGEPTETIYYVCSADVNGTRVNERPGLNEAISRLVGKDVYGFAIIAPASAFGGERL